MNEHQKLAYNVGKIKIPAGKQKTCRLTVIARLLAIGLHVSWLTGGFMIPYLLRMRSSVARLPYDEHHCWYVLAKAVQAGDRSNIRPSQARILDWSTGHD